MAQLTFHKTLVLSSDKATNVSALGSEFTTVLDKEITFPRNTVQASVYLDRLVTTYTYPNITEPNNHLYIDDNGVFYDVVIPKGLYNLTALNSAIVRVLTSLGGDPNTLKLVGDTSRQIVIIQYLKTGVQVDFTQPDTIRDILGFNSRFSPPAPSAAVNETDDGDTVAQFNKIKYLLLECPSLVKYGYSLDSTSSTPILAQIPITVAPSKQLIYEPTSTPDKIDVIDVVFGEIQDLSFRLLDQDRNPVDTNNDSFSVKIVFEYKVQVSDRVNQ